MSDQLKLKIILFSLIIRLYSFDRHIFTISHVDGGFIGHVMNLPFHTNLFNHRSWFQIYETAFFIQQFETSTLRYISQHVLSIDHISNFNHFYSKIIIKISTILFNFFFL